MNRLPPSLADGASDAPPVASTQRLDDAIAESRELQAELRLTMFRLRLVLTQYEESVHNFHLV